MTINNPLSVKRELDQQTVEQTTELTNQRGLIQTHVTNDGASTRADIAQAVLDIVSALAVEINENQTLIEGLSSVGGQVDTSATTINNHTTAEIATVLASIAAKDFTELDANVSSRATALDVTNEVTRTTAGSLYALLTAVIHAARDNNNAQLGVESGAIVDAVNAARDNTNNELVRTTAGSLYALMTTVVNAARDSVKVDIAAKDFAELDANVSSRATPANVTAARDNVKTELVRTTAGSLYALIEAAIGSARDNIKNGRDLNDIFNEINTERAAITSAITTARNDIRGTGNHSNTELRARILERATAGNVTAARDNVKAEIVRTTTGSLYALLAAVINAARDSIKDGYDLRDIFNEINTERAAIVNAINAARDSVNANVDTVQVVKSVQSITFDALTNYAVAGGFRAMDIPLSTAVNPAKTMIIKHNVLVGLGSPANNQDYTFDIKNSTTARLLLSHDSDNWFTGGIQVVEFY